MSFNISVVRCAMKDGNLAQRTCTGLQCDIWQQSENLACCAGGKGFSFATWLRLEDATCQPGTCGRSLFNLIHRSPEEVRGLSVAMKGTLLHLASWAEQACVTTRRSSAMLSMLAQHNQTQHALRPANPTASSQY